MYRCVNMYTFFLDILLDKEKKTIPDESPEPERKKLKGALGGLACKYFSLILFFINQSYIVLFI